MRLLLAEAGAGPPGKGVSMTQEMAPEMATLKARLKDTWMAGDYGHAARYLPGLGAPSCRLTLFVLQGTKHALEQTCENCVEPIAHRRPGAESLTCMLLAKRVTAASERDALV